MLVMIEGWWFNSWSLFPEKLFSTLCLENKIYTHIHVCVTGRNAGYLLHMLEKSEVQLFNIYKTHTNATTTLPPPPSSEVTCHLTPALNTPASVCECTVHRLDWWMCVCVSACAVDIKGPTGNLGSSC